MKRNITIDSIRVLAIISVIFAHVEGSGMAFGPVAKFISHVRFAVPFFLIVAGLQWGRKIRAGAPIGGAYAGLSSRILKMFAFWSLVYLFIPFDTTDIPKYLHAFSQHGAFGLLQIPYLRVLWTRSNARGTTWQG